jgi:hypothetical protein
MDKQDPFLLTLKTDADGYPIWPDDAAERRQFAGNIFGLAVIDALVETRDEMLRHVDGRWPSPGSGDYEAERRVADLFSSMTPQQREAVASLVRDTAHLSFYSLFLAFEHFNAGRVRVSVQPLSGGEMAEEQVPVKTGEIPEWHVAFLDWEDRFAEADQGSEDA